MCSSQASALRELRTVFADGLANLAAYHDVRHSKHLVKFVERNYPHSVFIETDSAVAVRILRTYRTCCCNAYIYRILRLGATPLWQPSGTHGGEDSSDSYFCRLGRSFAQHQSSPAMQWEIALLLWHQFYDVPSTPSAGRVAVSSAKSPSRYAGSTRVLSGSAASSSSPSRRSSTRTPASPTVSTGSSTLHRATNAHDVVKADILAAVGTDTLANELTRECLYDPFRAKYETTKSVSYSAREFERGLRAEHEHTSSSNAHAPLTISTSANVVGEYLMNRLIELVLDRMQSRARSVFKPRQSVQAEELDMMLTMIEQLAQALRPAADRRQSASPDVGGIDSANLERILDAIRAFAFDGVKELEICLRLLQQHCDAPTRVTVLLSDFDVFAALMPRLGHCGVRAHGCDSCAHVLDFVLFVIKHVEHEDGALMLSRHESFVRRVFELLEVNGDHVVRGDIAERAIRILYVAARPLSRSSDTSSSNGDGRSELSFATARSVLHILEQPDTVAAAARDDQTGSSGPDSDARPPFWQTLLQYLIRIDCINSVVRSVLDMLHWFLQAEPAKTLEQLLDHAALPVLCNLVTSADAAVQSRALMIMSATLEFVRSTTDRRVVSALASTFASCQHPFYDGMLAPLTLRSSVRDTKGGSSSRVRADQAHVLDLLRRLPLFARIQASDLAHVGEVVSPMRFRQHDVLLENAGSNYEAEATDVFVILRGDVTWTLTADVHSSERVTTPSVECVLTNGCAFGHVHPHVTLDAKDVVVCERAVAATEVTCLVLSLERLRALAPDACGRIAAGLQAAATNASGVVRHLTKHRQSTPVRMSHLRTSCFETLVSLALDASAEDDAMQRAATTLLIALCRQYRHRIETTTDVQATEHWILHTLFVLLARECLPVELRRELMRLTLAMTRHSNRDVAVGVLANWRRAGGSCGLVVLTKSFDACADDRASLLAWTTCVAHLLQQHCTARGSTIVRAMDDAALLTLFTTFLVATQDAQQLDALARPLLDVLVHLSESSYSRFRMVRCLAYSGRVELCHRLFAIAAVSTPAPQVLKDDGHTDSYAVLRILANLSRHSAFASAAVALPAWTSDAHVVLNELHLVTTMASSDAGTRDRTLALLELLCNVLDSVSASTALRRSVVVWMHESLGLASAISSFFALPSTSSSASDQTRAAALAKRVLSMCRALLRICDASTEQDDAVASALRDCSRRWLADVQTLVIGGATSSSLAASDAHRIEMLQALKISIECAREFGSLPDDWRDRRLVQLMRVLRNELHECWTDTVSSRMQESKHTRCVLSVLSASASMLDRSSNHSGAIESDVARLLFEQLEDVLARIVEIGWSQSVHAATAHEGRKVAHAVLLLQRSALRATRRLRGCAPPDHSELTTRLPPNPAIRVALVRLLSDVVARSNTSHPATAVRLAGACLVEVVRDPAIVQALARADATALISSLFGLLKHRVALSVKLRALWYLCRASPDSVDDAHDALEDAFEQSQTPLEQALFAHLDMSARSVCYQAKLLSWLIDQRRTSAFAMTGAADAERIAASLLSLVTTAAADADAIKTSEHQRDQAVAGLRGLVALLCACDTPVRDDVITTFTFTVIQIVRCLLEPDKELPSAQHLSLFQLCLESIRDVHSDAKYAAAVATVLAANADVLIGWHKILAHVPSSDLTLRTAVYNFVALSLGACSGQSKRELQLDLNQAADWTAMLQVETIAERARIAQCVRLMCAGNDTVLRAYLAPRSRFAQTIVATLSACVVPALAASASTELEQETRQWQDVCVFTVHSCAILRSLLIFDVTTLRANAIDAQNCLVAVASVLHELLMLAPLSVDTDVQSTEWTGTELTHWINATAATLSAVRIVLRHHRRLCLDRDKLLALPSTLFLVLRHRELGDDVLYVALKALRRLLLATLAVRSHRWSSRTYRLRADELLREHGDELLEFADFSAGAVVVKSKVRIASLEVLHALSVTLKRTQLDAPELRGDTLDQVHVERVLTAMLGNVPTSVSSEVLADIADMPRLSEATENAPLATSELFEASWTAFIRASELPAGETRHRQRRQTHQRLCAFTLFVCLATRMQATHAFVRSNLRGICEHLVLLYDALRADKQVKAPARLSYVTTRFCALPCVTMLETPKHGGDDDVRALLSTAPLDLVQRLLRDLGANDIVATVPVILTLCHAQRRPRHVLTDHVRECLDALPSCVAQMTQALADKNLPVMSCLLSLVTEMLIAAAQDGWGTSMHDRLDVDERHAILRVVHASMKNDAHIELPAKVQCACGSMDS